MNIQRVIQLLAQEYGSRNWQRHRDPVSELVMTILSQNTSDTNSRRAFTSLLASFGSWEAVAEGEVEHIAQTIHSGGLHRVKAARLKQVLQTLLQEHGSFDLSFLEGLPLSQAKSWLRCLPGVGPKTAGCVLLFSLGRPALPVDTHVYRVAKRLGLIDSRVSAERAHEVLEELVPADRIYEFHLNMVQHGRQVCKARKPRYPECIFRQDCPSSDLRNK